MSMAEITGLDGLRCQATYASSMSQGRLADSQATHAASSLVPVIDATRLRVVIARLSRRLRRHQLAGLSPTQLSALATVERIGPLRLGDLAAAEGIAPSTLTRLVTALEEAGYVQRHAEPADARASRLAITREGQAMLARVREETTMVLTVMLADLTREQQAAIAVALPALEQLAGPDPREPQNR